MRLSAKFSVLAFILAAGSLGIMIYISENMHSQSDMQDASMFGFFAFVFSIVGVLFLLVWAIRSFLDKKNDNIVYDKSINAVNSTVATEESTIDNSLSINNSGEIGNIAIEQLRESIDESDLTGRDKKFAQLLVDNIKTELDSGSEDKTEVESHFSSLKEILTSTSTLASAGMKAYEILRKLMV